RFLSEKYPAKKGRLPRIVLDIWRKADGARGKPDQYSWQAINTVLRTKRTTGAAMLGAYAVANRRPAKRYAEGRANRYPTSPLIGTVGVTPRRGARASFKLNHLSTATARLTPQGLDAPGWKLRLTFDLPSQARGSSALVTSTSKAGRATTKRVRLNRQGNGVLRAPFSKKKVANVEVTIVNGGGHFKCFVPGGNFSCSGKPLDNGLQMKFTAFAVR
ncbi:MAG: hypothetical protein Q7T71_18485, partial [Herbiconiux sp.]|nr:hypothetical protein [Herbiconiux sp.]